MQWTLPHFFQIFFWIENGYDRRTSVGCYRIDQACRIGRSPMPRRFLFGPVPAAFAEQNLARYRAAGQCLTFGRDGNPDLVIQPGDTWAKISTRFLAGWKPE